MSMLYQIIGQAINKAGLADMHHPKDYLNFYCLGKRESSSIESPLQTCNSSENRALVWHFPSVVNKLTITCIIHPKKNISSWVEYLIRATQFELYIIVVEV